jgi:hypothetical protein
MGKREENTRGKWPVIHLSWRAKRGSGFPLRLLKSHRLRNAAIRNRRPKLRFSVISETPVRNFFRSTKSAPKRALRIKDARCLGQQGSRELFQNILLVENYLLCKIHEKDADKNRTGEPLIRGRKGRTLCFQVMRYRVPVLRSPDMLQVTSNSRPPASPQAYFGKSGFELSSCFLAV